MSFSNTLNRLREAAKGQRDRKGDVLVSAFDLRDLLNDYDRIDTKYRALNEHREPDYKTDLSLTGEYHHDVNLAFVYKAQRDELLNHLKWSVGCLDFDVDMPIARRKLQLAYEAIAKASASTDSGVE